MAKADTTSMTAQDFERFNETDFGVIFENGKAKILDEAKLIAHQNNMDGQPLCCQCRFYKAGVQEQIENALKPAFFHDYSKTKCIDCTEIARQRRFKARRQEKIEEGINPDVPRKRRTKTEILAQSTSPLAIPDEIREAMESIKEMRETIQELTTNNERLDTRIIQLAEENKVLRKENTEMQDAIEDLRMRIISSENRVNDKHERLDELAAESESKAKELQEMIYEFKNSYQTKSSIQAGIKAELEEIRIRLLDEVNSTVVPVQEQVQVCAENLDQLQELVESTIDSVATAPTSPQPPESELAQVNSPVIEKDYPLGFEAAEVKEAEADEADFEDRNRRYKAACKKAEEAGLPPPDKSLYERRTIVPPRPTFW